MMWPREHGAYGQLVFPLLTGLAIAGVSAPAILIAVAAVAGFLAHEPLLVLLGRRGVRVRREQGARATLWAAVTGAAAVGAGSAALWLAPAEIRWSFAFPLAPAALLAWTVVAGREKSAAGEIAAAVAFSFVAIPLCMASGARPATALAVGLAFATLFSASTLGVRIVILKVRAGGDAAAVRLTRIALLACAGGAPAGLAIAAVHDVLPAITLVAVMPGLAASLVLAARPPAPARLRTVGWTLMSVSVITAALLVAGLPATSANSPAGAKSSAPPNPPHPNAGRSHTELNRQRWHQV